MGTIMLLAAFVLAASANPLERLSGEYSEDKLQIHDQDEHDSFHDVVPTNASQYSGGDDASPHVEEPGSSSADSPVSSGDASDTHDEEHGLSSSESPVSSEGDSRKRDEEPFPSNDTPPDFTGNDGSANAGDVVSSSVSTVNKTSTETATDGNETEGSDPANTSSYPTLSTNSASASNGSNKINGSDQKDTFSNHTLSTISTNDSTSTEPSTTYVTQPPDGDPEDCNAADPTNHVYLLCTFLCDGDMMETAKDNATCLLGAGTPTPIPAVQERRIPKNATLGVCSGGTCVERSVEATSPVAVA